MSCMDTECADIRLKSNAVLGLTDFFPLGFPAIVNLLLGRQADLGATGFGAMTHDSRPFGNRVQMRIF
jgi:hypothetical protein